MNFSLLAIRDLTVGWNGRARAFVKELLVHAGRTVVLAGPNGVGKSTTMKTLARQIEPLSGTVQLDGIDAGTMTPREFARQVAYVPQLFDPPADMLVRDVVALGRNPHQMWWSWHLSDADRRAIETALAATQTDSIASSLCGELSGGERQRVAIAAALAQEAAFLLLDEPTAHLDFKHQLQLLELLKQLKEGGLGMLVAMHDLNLIARLADEVVLLKPGGSSGCSEIAASGAVDHVLNFSTLLDVYEVEVAITNDPATGTRSYVPVAARGAR